MKPSDLRKLNTRVAYPWPLGDDMPDDVTGMGTDEIIYGASQIADPYQDQENEQ